MKSLARNANILQMVNEDKVKNCTMTLFNHRKEENLSFVTQRMDLEDIRLKGICKGHKDKLPLCCLLKDEH
jgi:hypothetical protein